MEKSTREALLDAGLELLGRVGFRGWSMRGVEDEAGVPHGSARHHFTNQRGLVLEMVRHLLDGDLPAPGETPQQQVARWLGSEAGRTRARYELIVASFHDAELAAVMVHGRERLVAVLRAHGLSHADAALLATALDGMVLDALLRRLRPEAVDPQRIIDRFIPPAKR
ncbi:TetR/AcrR family transcriptional regulator [Rhodococcus spongiicola]|uniref:TetR/AcrR family transcriptional regulator n=1 Tax=Rhodococcus spongiicola TaxID=2487352 RepID=A0A438ANF4_9NOCA|nr:TetR/AcrR family transcriptional regulator [Rhodococcus spongiicola]RVW00388.1 TetR/AcrR family transcriptional regulator [Rhodococcus spongiicola]